MTGAQVNGMDVVEVYEATQAALQRIRDGEGPQFLEMITYRFEGHSMGDPLRYRTKDEVEKWREDDPDRHLGTTPDQRIWRRRKKNLTKLTKKLKNRLKKRQCCSPRITAARAGHALSTISTWRHNLMACITMRQAITDALREEMLRDESVFIMGEEVGVWGGTYAVTRGFYDEFGEKRVRDTPISEMVIGGAATGAAMNGLRPVAEFMTINFAFLALDAIVNHAAKIHYMFGGQMKVPVVFRAPAAAAASWGPPTATRRTSSLPIFPA